jgi:hypothetical protein
MAFSQKQREQAAEFLRNPQDVKSEHGPDAHSEHLFQQLRAKVILGEFRVDKSQDDWNLARSNLTATHQTELRKLLGWED